ncbi:DUF892 family protein [Sinorhizobium meliloti]|uniref:DUF892 family protein n=2 Tax=Rhizobium meliloti TaxID=382 RepID=UPI001F3B7A8E|nr:DUF892 family protein [Sinorhizobium meliloti]
MEEQTVTILTSQSVRLENYPGLKARTTTFRKTAIRSSCLIVVWNGSAVLPLSRISPGGLDPSARASADCSSTTRSSRGSLASYAFEQMEIASYKILIAAAEHAGDQETKRVCDAILQQELTMAQWLDEHAATITRSFSNAISKE